MEEYSGFIQGYIATTAIDSQGDQLTPQVIEKFADDLTKNPQKRTLYFNHDMTQPMGYVTEFHVETKGEWKGLFAKVGIFKSRLDLWAKIQSGELTGFSFGARVLGMERKMSHNNVECNFTVDLTNIDWDTLKDTLTKMGAKVDVTVRKAVDAPTSLAITANVATIAGLIFQIYTYYKLSRKQNDKGKITISTSKRKFNFDESTLDEIVSSVEVDSVQQNKSKTKVDTQRGVKMDTDERLDGISSNLNKMRQEYLRDKYENLSYILWGFTLAMVGLTIASPHPANIAITIVFFIMGWIMWVRARTVKVK